MVFSQTFATLGFAETSHNRPGHRPGPAGRDGPPEQRGPAGQRRGRLRQWPGPDPENEGEKSHGWLMLPRENHRKTIGKA